MDMHLVRYCRNITQDSCFKLVNVPRMLCLLVRESAPSLKSCGHRIPFTGKPALQMSHLTRSQQDPPPSKSYRRLHPGQRLPRQRSSQHLRKMMLNDDDDDDDEDDEEEEEEEDEEVLEE